LLKLICLSWCLVCSNVSAMAFCSSNDVKMLRLSYEAKQPLPLVKANVNDKELSFLLDTGASWTLLMADAAQKLALFVPRIDGTVSGVGGNAKTTLTKARSFEVGNVRETNPYFGVLLEFGFKPYFDGILGIDYLLKNSIGIDIRNSILYLYPLGSCNFDALLQERSLFFSENYRNYNLDDIRPRFTLRSGEHKFTTIIDTGASVSTAHINVVQKLSIPLNLEDTSKLRSVDGVGGRVKTVPIQIHSLEFGNHTLGSRQFLLENGVASDKNSGVDLILGLDFLRHYVVILDAQKKRILIKKN
jgi:predicted aspartyl protease